MGQKYRLRWRVLKNWELNRKRNSVCLSDDRSSGVKKEKILSCSTISAVARSKEKLKVIRKISRSAWSKYVCGLTSNEQER